MSPESQDKPVSEVPSFEPERSRKKRGSRLTRFLRYFYLRFIRLRGDPRELALGMALGICVGSMPILPFQTVAALALAMIFRGSKIAAALGTWISNPANWYFLYLYSYKIGAWVLGLSPSNEIVGSILTSVRQKEDGMVIVGKILEAGGSMVAAFLTGGLVLGFLTGVPSYFVFLRVFRSMDRWRAGRKGMGHWPSAGV